MNAPTDGPSVAEEIERLARAGATAGELLGMLPADAIHTAIECIAEDADWNDGRYQFIADRLYAVVRVLQTELDSRSV